MASVPTGMDLAHAGVVMTKTDAARFLMDLSQPLAGRPGPRIVRVQSTPPTKAFVAENLERLEALSKLQRCDAAVWVQVCSEFAELEHHALRLGLVHVAKASGAVRSMAAMLQESMMLDAEAAASVLRRVNTPMCALLLRVYVEGDDRNGEPELENVQDAVRDIARQLGARRGRESIGIRCN